jgi:hypothetical protein
MRSWYQLCTAVLLSSLALGVHGNEVKVVCTAASIETELSYQKTNALLRTRRKRTDNNAQACSVAKAGAELLTPSS